jgi:arylsulfatase A-like enzyme
MMVIARSIWLGLLALFATVMVASTPAAAQKKPNIVMLMTDDTGWNDFGYMPGGGKALGHPTPNIDRIAAEGAMFTDWYGQASCTAGRASFMTGRIPIRSALSIVVAPGDPNALKKETPTIAEFFKKNGYSTYFSGKWHLGDKPDAYPIEHGFDEMKHFGAYYPGVYAYNDTSPRMHPWFPSYNAAFNEMYNKVVNLGEWEGVAGQPATKTGTIDWDYLATFDMRQTDSAVAYIKQHANDAKPFFMDINFMKMHNPNNPAPQFRGRTKLGDYSDAMLELDYNIGRVMDAIRAEAPDTIVIVTADNGAWQDAWPDAGTVPFRGEKGSAFEGGWRVPGLMWWPGKIPARAKYDEMMSHIDCWATLATMVGLTAPPKGEMMDNNGKPIYFDSIDNSAYILGKAEHSARDSWIYIDGETFMGMRVDIGGDPKEPWLRIAWKYLYTAKEPGSAPRLTSAPSARYTTSPWTPMRSTT